MSETSEINSSNNKISSSSSASSSVNFPAKFIMCRKVTKSSMVGNNKVNMHQFINSAGKSINKNGNNFSPFAPFNENQSANDYYELKPVQFNNNITFRRRVSAISKIQQELRDMAKREEELRWQRTRYIGLSEPNLNTITDNSDNDSIKEEHRQQSFTDDLAVFPTNNKPNIIDNEYKLEKNRIIDQECKVGGPRRRIPLIALWEQKIQQEVKIKD